ncbi:DNA sulfur modification protein DndB [Colwellia sp. Arc7-D]|uniref:DNA sulfur modification protein DndB n=1 Tax=Colwellia sp. Arc7-D TaxID=2161872 RepID=UPI000D3CA190|nr:DNA sulfur modification protein DndB [Colwellia sp. Arc7-D]AWB57200.1 DNA sulfur modification protein DndB [Colwellia sp. Arc7-D]
MQSIISGTSFPAIKGIQANAEYYTVMCPLKRLSKIFTTDQSQFSVDKRAQRLINEARIPDITNYILEQREKYVFSSITACIDGSCEFISIGKSKHEQRIGTLIIDEDAEIYITDGQHRNAAILEALKEDPSLADETISVVFFANKTLDERQRIFKDLNYYSVKTDGSLSITYDDKPDAIVSKTIILNSPRLTKLVHMESSNLGPRSKKLISHSAVNRATKLLCGTINYDNHKKLIPIAANYWEQVVKNIPAWLLVCQDEISGGELRDESIHAHSVTFQALGIVGRYLLENDKNWKKTLKELKKVDWSRKNKNWDGRCVINGSMHNNPKAAQLTAIKIKLLIGSQLTDKEVLTEKTFIEAKNEF